MALIPQNAGTRLDKNGAFVSFSRDYLCDHGDETCILSILVLAKDLLGNANPSTEQILAVADPRAVSKYNAWCAALDAAPTETLLDNLSTSPLA